MSRYKKLTDAMYANLTPKERINYAINTLSINMGENPVDIKRAMRKAVQRTSPVSVKRYKENTLTFDPMSLLLCYITVKGTQGGFEFIAADFDALFDGKPYTLGAYTEEKKEAMIKAYEEDLEDTKNLLMSPYDNPMEGAKHFADMLGCDPDTLCTVIAGALRDDWYEAKNGLSAVYSDEEDTFTVTYKDNTIVTTAGDIFTPPSAVLS